MLQTSWLSEFFSKQQATSVRQVAKEFAPTHLPSLINTKISETYNNDKSISIAEIKDEVLTLL